MTDPKDPPHHWGDREIWAVLWAIAGLAFLLFVVAAWTLDIAGVRL